VTKNAAKFSQHYAPHDTVYAWGANRVGDLDKLETGDFVVDVKNKKVVQIFQFGLWVETTDALLQDFIGWDSEKPKEKRRPYKIVYFLDRPLKTLRQDKAFFQIAFANEANQNWLVGQKWFSPSDTRNAMTRTNTRSIEQLLGIVTGSETSPIFPTEPHETLSLAVEPEKFEKPEWLLPVIDQVDELKSDHEHQERDHEDVVARFFECLGYRRTRDIKYRRGRIDILIEHDKKALIVIEVKRDWALSKDSKSYVQQAFNYALEAGARYVIITNGDRYILYDRQKGLSYDDNLVMQFTLSRLTRDCLNAINNLRPTLLGASNTDG